MAGAELCPLFCLLVRKAASPLPDFSRPKRTFIRAICTADSGPLRTLTMQSRAASQLPGSRH